MNIDNVNSKSMYQAAADEIQPAGDEIDSSNNQQSNKRNSARGKSKSARKLSPDLMRIVLDALRERPILPYAAKAAGIHLKTLRYWLKRSEADHEDYYLEWQGFTQKFHQHRDWAIELAHDRVIDIVKAIALGFRFKIDQFLVDLGFRGIDAFEKDENGEFIMEQEGPKNEKMIRFYLEWRFPEKYGKRRKIEPPQTGGVLVIGMPHERDNKPKPDTAASTKTREWKSIVRAIGDADA